MKLASVVTTLALAVTASWGMGTVAFAGLICEQSAAVQTVINCIDQFNTDYLAAGFADANSVTVVLSNGDGSPVRADTAGFDAQGNQVARAVTVTPGSSESDTKDPGDAPIVTHDLLLFAG
jgi:hypothetical protein